jgi:phospholipase/lecithinase/hemolysin
MGMLFFGLSLVPAQAAFNTLYAFGDGVCTTTNNVFGGVYYHGKSYSNGRIWIEILAERQGLSYDSNKNWSYFGHDSTNLVINVNNFTAPADASNALFVVWCIDADFVWNANNAGTNMATWTNALNHALTNHYIAITNLYAKGVRTIIMPNAVDITKVPYYVYYAAAKRAFIRQRAIDFNAAFAVMLSNTAASFPDLTIHQADLFTLLDDVLARPADYGLTNALDAGGKSVDALVYYGTPPLDGPATNFIFWDNLDPTAKLHAHIADYIQKTIWPPQLNKLAAIAGTNYLDAVNVPVGRAGIVEGTTNLVSWTGDLTFDSTNISQTIPVPSSGPLRYYRLRFPFSWTWP